MGTDIHGFFQRRPKTPRRSDYRLVPRWRSDEYYGQDYQINVDVLGLGDNPNDWRSFDREVLRDRNYILFAILADVRNGYGFAGCETHDPIKPLRTGEQSRLPNDILFSPRCQTLSPGSDDCTYNSRWLGYHSQQVITAEEILSYDFQQRLVEYGVFAIDEFIKFMLGDRDVGYSYDVWGEPIVKHPRVDLTDGKAVVFNTKGYTHIPAKWNDDKPIIEYVKDFVADVKQIVADNPDYDIRLVIGFDS
jgi:hypothetical protein